MKKKLHCRPILYVKASLDLCVKMVPVAPVRPAVAAVLHTSPWATPDHKVSDWSTRLLCEDKIMLVAISLQPAVTEKVLSVLILPIHPQIIHDCKMSLNSK